MCGILGLIINAQNGGVWKDAEAFEQMLYIDALRGEDSTGIGMFTNEGGLRLTKGAMDANTFLKSTEWASVRSDWVSRGKAMIGHNRKKTIGQVKDETAHPFLIDNRYLFIHNGTLNGHKYLADTEVDSEALGIVLANCNGDKEKLEEVLGKVYGAYACAWIDKEKEMLYLLRNKDRPLFIAKYEAGWVFCSEPGFMQLAFMRQGFKLTDIAAVPEHTLVSFDLTKHTQEPVVEGLTPKKHMGTMSTTQTSSSSGARNTDSGVSKSAFKRFSKNGMQGRTIKFKIVDYIEKFPNDPNCTSFNLMSESDDIPFAHTIHHGLNECLKNELEDFYMDQTFTGIITGLSYNQKSKSVDVYVGKADIDWGKTNLYSTSSERALH